MSQIIRGAVAVLFLAALGLGCASSTKAAMPVVSHRGEGLVETVDPDQNKVAVVGIKDQSGPLWFNIMPDTEIEMDGQRAKITDLRPGTPVEVAWAGATGAERAYRIKILTGGEAAKVRTDVRERGYGGAGSSTGTNPQE